MSKLENWQRAIREGEEVGIVTSATPKPRAGEHTSERALEELDVIETCDRALLIHSLPAYTALAAQNRELVEALTYCEISTRADGQWADQSVHTFLLSILAKHGR